MSPDAWPSRSQSDRPGPVPGLTHQKMLGEIHRQIANFLEDKPCDVFAVPFDVLLPEPGETEDETSTIVQPNISVICDEAKLSEKGWTGPPTSCSGSMCSPATAMENPKSTTTATGLELLCCRSLNSTC